MLPPVALAPVSPILRDVSVSDLCKWGSILTRVDTLARQTLLTDSSEYRPPEEERFASWWVPWRWTWREGGLNLSISG